MTYSLHWTGLTKGSINLDDHTFDTTSTSLTLIGKGQTNHGDYLQNNLLGLLENFCNTFPPAHPTDGQLWFDVGYPPRQGDGRPLDLTARAYSEGRWKRLNREVLYPVRVAMTNAMISGALQGLPAGPIDGVTLQAGDRVLIPDQGNRSLNGIWVVEELGLWSLVSHPVDDVINGTSVFVTEGSQFSRTCWLQTGDPGAPIYEQLRSSSTTIVDTGGNPVTVDVTSGLGILANSNNIAIDPLVVAQLNSSASFTDLSLSSTLTFTGPQAIITTTATTASLFDGTLNVVSIGSATDLLTLGKSNGALTVMPTTSFLATDISASYSSGAVTIVGGLGVGKNLNIKDNLGVGGGTINTTSTSGYVFATVTNLTLGGSSNIVLGGLATIVSGNDLQFNTATFASDLLVKGTTFTKAIQVGDIAHAGQTNLDLISSTQSAYDVRLAITGGTTTAGQGSLNVEAASFTVNNAELAFIDSPSFTGTPTAPTPSRNDSSTKLATTAFVQLVGIPTGMIAQFAMHAAPTGWLECDGSAISRTDYSDLFTAIGVTFGIGDNVTTFNLPDMRGNFARGWDHGRGIDPGRAFGSSQQDDFKSHKHAANSGQPGLGQGASGPNAVQQNMGSEDTSYTGGTETRPKNIALLFCIKY